MHLKVTVCVALATACVIALRAPAGAQSGRGRPRVPAPRPAEPPPPPVKVPEGTAVTNKEQAGNASRFLLKNGMTVIVSEQHASPVAAVAAYFKAGFLNEPATLPGSAHLCEHLLARTAAGKLRAIGGSISSHSSPASTGFTILVSPRRIKEALSIQAEMIQRPAVTDADLQREVAAVVNEYKWHGGTLPRHHPDNDGEPSSYVHAKLSRLAFSPVSTGPAVDVALRSATRQQVADLCKSLFRPDNLVVAVAGDVATFDTLVEVQRLYGGFTAAAPAPASQQGGAQSKLLYNAEKGDLSRPLISIGYRLEGLTPKEVATFEVLAALAGGGRASRLHESLVLNQGVAARVEAEWERFGELGLLVFQFWPLPQAIDRAEAAFFKEIDRLRREPPSAEELDRAKGMAQKRLLDSTNGYSALANWLAVGAGDGLLRVGEGRERIRAVTPEDVQRAAVKHLGLANTVVHEYEPYSGVPRTFDSESYAATVAAWVPGLTQPVNVKEATSPSAATPRPGPSRRRSEGEDELSLLESLQPVPVRDYSTLAGPRAYVREDHSQQQVAVALLFQGGRLIEEETSAGTTELMLRWLLHGTPRRPATQVAQELAQLGATVETIAEPDFFGFMLTVLSENGESALRLVREMIEEPAFRDEDLERARAEQLLAIQSSRDSARERSKELLAQLLYPGHPYSFAPHGREDVVQRLKGEQVKEWYARTVKRQFPLVVVVGDTNGSALISAEVAERFRRRDVDRTISARVPRQPAAGDKADQSEQRRRAGSVLAIGFVGIKADGPDAGAIELIAAALNGPEGLFSIANGWAVMRSERLQVGGHTYIQVATLPGTEAASQQTAAQELSRLAGSGLTSDELASAVELFVTKQTALLQSHPLRALEYARAIFSGLEATAVDGLTEAVTRVTADSIKRVAGQFRAARVGQVRGEVPIPPTQ